MRPKFRIKLPTIRFAIKVSEIIQSNPLNWDKSQEYNQYTIHSNIPEIQFQNLKLKLTLTEINQLNIFSNRLINIPNPIFTPGIHIKKFLHSNHDYFKIFNISLQMAE